MARVWRLSLITAKWTLLVLSSLVLLVVAINAIDEDLSPEAKALLVAPPNPNRPEDNLYFALLGIEAPQGVSPLAAAQKRIASHEKEVAAARKDPRYMSPDPLGHKEEKMAFQGKVEFCRPLQKSCVADVESHKVEIARLLKANRDLHQRYLRLHHATGYYETATPSFYVLSPYAPLAARQLYLANIALQIKSGTLLRQKAALADLGNDMRIWRLMLTGDGSLISKMIAIANLHGDYAVLADIVADRKFDVNRHSAAIRVMLDLHAQDDWKLGKIFAIEYGISVFLWDQMRSARALGVWMTDHPFRKDQEWWEPYLEMLQYPFLKINATQNLNASVMLQLQKMADSDPKEYFAARDAYRNWARTKFDLGLHYIYNPVGKNMMDFGADLYGEYPMRAFDAAAFHRLVRLAFEIRSRGIGTKDVPPFMEQHPQWATHPVDGKPFIWNEEKQEIAVQPLANQPKERRFGIPVLTAGLRKK